MHCPNCGKELKDNQKFCGGCGTNVEKFLAEKSAAESEVTAEAEAPASEAPVEASEAEAPSEAPASEAPVETSEAETPSEAPASEAPVEASEAEAPAEAPASEAPVEASEAEAPAEPTVEAAPAPAPAPMDAGIAAPAPVEAAPAPAPAPMDAGIAAPAPVEAAPAPVANVPATPAAAIEGTPAAAKPKKSKKPLFIILGAVAGVLIIGGGIGAWFITRFVKYGKAMDAFEAKEYSTSYEMFTELKSFKDSEYMAEYSQVEIDFLTIDELVEKRDFDGIIKILKDREEFFDGDKEGKEAAKLAEEYEIVKAGYAAKDAGEYVDACDAFDSLELLKDKFADEPNLCRAHISEQSEDWTGVFVYLYAITISDYDTKYITDPQSAEEQAVYDLHWADEPTVEQIDAAAAAIKPADDEQQAMLDNAVLGLKYDVAIEYMNNQDYENAMALFESLGDYQDSKDMYDECKSEFEYCEEQYALGQSYFDNGEFYKAKDAWEGIAGYKDADDKASKCVQTLPENGSMLIDPDGEIELTITAPSTKSILFRVYDSNGEVVAQVFIAAGESATLYLDTGTYNMKVALGTEWYGDKDLFGGSGLYKKIFNGESEDLSITSGHYYKLDVVDNPYTTIDNVPGGASGM